MSLLRTPEIGGVKLENNVFLAPMAGITDQAFRILCREQGAGLVCSEMVSAKGMHYNDARSFRLTEIDDSEMPAAVQIFGSDPLIMSGITEKLNNSKAIFIDINMGCPTPKITKNGEGSALMLNPLLAGQIIRAVSKVSVKPVTVKIRKGWDEDHINAVEMAKTAEQNGAAAIYVHGRTRTQFYSGKADWGIITQVKKAVSIPVIGNGDIFEPQDAQRMLEETGCDAVLIARGAEGNPWIFRRTLKFLACGVLLPEPKFDEKLNMILRHMDMIIKLKGEHNGLCEMRKHIAWYLKGIHGAARLKEQVFKTNSRYGVETLLKDFSASALQQPSHIIE